MQREKRGYSPQWKELGQKHGVWEGLRKSQKSERLTSKKIWETEKLGKETAARHREKEKPATA